MENLFSYGTLQLESVQKETFGRKLIGKKDILIAYVLSTVRIKDASVIKLSGMDIHPILKYTGKNSDKVEGTVYEVTSLELEQADEYEVEDYVRVEGNFTSGKIAWIYAAAKK
ncbi:MAG: gamma-glutamylcyclotransferase [Campylobacteraceae bacterium]|nr:gamma-glutamylcyclotransferase [Campylobacteraceae bacterium]